MNLDTLIKVVLTVTAIMLIALLAFYIWVGVTIIVPIVDTHVAQELHSTPYGYRAAYGYLVDDCHSWWTP